MVFICDIIGRMTGIVLKERLVSDTAAGSADNIDFNVDNANDGDINDNDGNDDDDDEDDDGTCQWMKDALECDNITLIATISNRSIATASAILIDNDGNTSNARYFTFIHCISHCTQ
jgi:hypothetical protein